MTGKVGFTAQVAGLSRGVPQEDGNQRGAYLPLVRMSPALWRALVRRPAWRPGGAPKGSLWPVASCGRGSVRGRPKFVGQSLAMVWRYAFGEFEMRETAVGGCTKYEVGTGPRSSLRMDLPWNEGGTEGPAARRR